MKIAEVILKANIVLYRASASKSEVFVPIAEAISDDEILNHMLEMQDPNCIYELFSSEGMLQA